jgi:hypothetical protein
VTVTDTKAKQENKWMHLSRAISEERDRAKELDPIPKEPTWRATTLSILTHMQPVATCLQIYRRMSDRMDRATLSRVDRKLASGLGNDETYRMVRVPVSEAIWSTWGRYCGGLGIPMGRAVAELIQSELRSVLGEPDVSPLLARMSQDLDERAALLDAREREIDDWEKTLSSMTRATLLTRAPVGSVPRVGRNEPCPCRSGLKYKRCHGVN